LSDQIFHRIFSLYRGPLHNSQTSSPDLLILISAILPAKRLAQKVAIFKTFPQKSGRFLRLLNWHGGMNAEDCPEVLKMEIYIPAPGFH
jgi:hypothetical protein